MKIIKNIIYFGAQEGFPIDTIEYLERELNFKPKLIIGDFSVRDKKKCKKNGYFFKEGSEALLNEKINKNLNIPKKLNKFIKAHKIIYEAMCSRFEFSKNNFSHKDVNDYIKNALLNWYTVIVKNKIDIVIFIDSPHRIYDYITFLICKYLKIPTLFFRDPNFYGKMLMEIDFEKSPSGISSFYIKKKNKNKYKNNLMKIENAHYRKFDKNKLYFNLEKIKRRLKINHHIESDVKINFFSFYLKYVFGKIHPITRKPFKILKFKNKFRLSRGYEYIFWIFKATLKTLLLKISYNLNSQHKLPTKYILFAMSYQPEATSFPDAGFFHNQYKLILEISRSLDKKTKLLVKEHPMQLNLLGAFNFKNPQTRNINIYRNLSNIKNIELLSQNYDMEDVTKNAIYTITLNGSVAIQSILNGTPALTFGHAWYVGCESIYKLKSPRDIKQFLNSKKFMTVSKSNVSHFMQCLSKQSIPLWFKKFHKNIYPYYKMNEFINRQNIKKIIKRDLKYFYKINV